jgi:hypothetical protein
MLEGEICGQLSQWLLGSETGRAKKVMAFMCRAPDLALFSHAGLPISSFLSLVSERQSKEMQGWTTC